MLGKSTELFCFLNACFRNVLLIKYSLPMECPVTTDKQSALFSRMGDILYIGNGLYFVKSHKQMSTEVLLSVCVNVLTLSEKSRYYFSILTYIFYSFHFSFRNCEYHHAEISLLQFPELIGHIAFLLESLPGSVTKATNPWLMIH